MQPTERQTLLNILPSGEQSARIVRHLDHLDDCDLFDVLADLAYGMAPLTRSERADAFTRKHAGWLADLPLATAATLAAITRQFAINGTDALETPYIFDTHDVRQAGGLAALRALGKPHEILTETKDVRRMIETEIEIASIPAEMQAPLPDGWQWVRLGEIGKYHNGRVFKPEDWKGSGLPIVRIQNLTSNNAPFNFYEGEVKETELITQCATLLAD